MLLGKFGSSNPTSGQRLVVRFRVTKDITVCLSLWDDVAATFRSHLASENPLESVMIVTTVNPKLFGGNLFLNSTPATRFFFHSNIDAIREFMDSVGISGNNTTFAKADTTESLGKMETVSIYELQEYISKEDEEVDCDTIETTDIFSPWPGSSCC